MSKEFSDIPFSQDLMFKILQRSIEEQDQKNRQLLEIIHEEVGTELMAIKMKLQNSNLSENTKNYVDLNLNALVQKIKLTSSLVFPAALEQLGLQEALLGKIRQYNAALDIEVRILNKLNKKLTLSNDESTAIFYIVDEVLKNCFQHSNCALVEIRYIQDDPLEIEILDDGSGFEYVPEIIKSEHRGLNEILCRANSINASLIFKKLPIKGSVVNIKMNG